MGRLSTVLRASSAVVLLAGAAGAALAATAYPPPGPADPVDLVRQIQVPATALHLACPSEPALPETGVVQDQDFQREQADAVARLAVASFPREGTAGSGVLRLDATEVPLAGDGALVAALDRFPGASWARVEPVGARAALAAGAIWWRADAGDLRALVVAPCAPPASETWLVGGATDVGSSARLELVNPGPTTATVTVQAWGPTGAVDLPLLTAVPVAAGTSQTVLLEANAAGIERMALRVVARGGQVGAAVLDSALDGLTPRGVDVVTPTLAPATELLLPGVSLAEASEPGADFVRILNPGEAAATVSVDLLTADGAVALAGAEAVTVDAQAVFDISLAGLPAGDHAVRVRSDLPVAAAAQVGRAADGALERAWAVSTPALRAGALLIPGGATGRLVLANDGAADAVVRLTGWEEDGAPGATRDVTVPAGATAAVETGTVVLDASEPVHAAVVLEAEAPDGTLVGVLPASPDADVRQTVGVLLTQ